MFTGLVEAVGRVVAVTPQDAGVPGVRLIIDPCGWPYGPAAGDSISVSGCCLTHVPMPSQPRALAFDVVPETLRKTKLGTLAVGGRVNLEACLTPTSRIGGHFVLGHVDGVGRIAAIDTAGGEHRLSVDVPDELVAYLTPTGSIALDGVSLTLAQTDTAARRFTVALIPTTLASTTLGDLHLGDPVNLEADVLAKTVVHAMRLGVRSTLS